VKKVKDRVLDRIDYKILRRLQENGRMTNADLARSVSLSPTPCLERVRRLEADGYILDYVALLNPQKLGAGVISFVQVMLDRTTPDVFERFKSQVGLCPEIVECFMVAGGFDYLLKVRTKSMRSQSDTFNYSLTTLTRILVQYAA
jgi:Lrp/AsnC family leucine-responsive transcriptional regulator